MTHIDGLPLSFALSIFTLLVVVWCMVAHDGIGCEMIKVEKFFLACTPVCIALEMSLVFVVCFAASPFLGY